MICKKCGNSVKDGYEFCPYCGAAIVQEKKQQSTLQDELREEEEMKIMFSQEAPFSHRIELPNETKKKKSKKVLAIVGALVAVILLVGVFSFQTIAGMVRRTLSSPESYYSYVELKGIEENADKWANMYDNMLASAEIAKTGNKNEISIEMGEQLQTMLATMLATDFSWLDKISLYVNAYNNEQSLGADAELGLNDEKLLGVNIAADVDANKLYMLLPELSANYLGFSLEEYEDMMYDSYYGYYGSEYSMSEMMNLFKESADITSYCEDGKTIKEFVERYSNILYSDVKNIVKTKETLEVGGISQECTVLTSNLTAKELVELLQKVLEEVKNDQEIKKIVETFIADMRKMDTSGEFDEDLSYEAFVEEITSAQEELASALEDVEETDTVLTNSIYVGKEDKIVGRKLVGKEDGEDVFTISFKRLENKKDFAMEFSYGDTSDVIAVTGQGTLEDSKENGTYKLLVNDVSVCTVEVKDYDVKSAEKGYLKGKYVLSLENGFFQLADGQEELAALLSAYQLELSCDMTKESSNMQLALLANGNEMISIGIKQEYGNEDASGSLPKDSDKVYNMLDESEVAEYLETVDWDVLVNKIEGLDIPDEYKNAISYYLSMMGIY